MYNEKIFSYIQLDQIKSRYTLLLYFGGQSGACFKRQTIKIIYLYPIPLVKSSYTLKPENCEYQYFLKLAAQ